MWTGAVGGHFEENELNNAKARILREMHEELGLGESDVQNLSLKYITLRQTKGEIRQNYYFFAALKDGFCDDMQSNEGRLRWFSFGELDALPCR